MQFPPGSGELDGEPTRSNFDGLSPQDASGSIEDLELQLAHARTELEEYQRLLNDLPGIYEGKFRQKFQSVTLQIRDLLDERKLLQEQVSRALMQSHELAELPPGVVDAASSAPSKWADVRLPRFQSPFTGSPSFSLTAIPRPAFLLSFPQGRNVGVALGSGIALVLLVLGLTYLWSRRSEPSIPGLPMPARGERPQLPTTANLRVEARGGQSWLLVEQLGGGKVYDAILEPGQSKVLSLGTGLRIRSGRPDLLHVGVGGAPPVPLGGVSDLDWFEFRP
jgi:hypothetical protein